MYITICKTDDLCKFKGGSRAPTAGALGQSRGWGEEGGGRVIRDGGHMCTMADSGRCMAKTITIL